MIFYLCIALNINILLSSELCWCETTTFFTLLTSHIINRHPTFIHVRPPGVPNEYQQHIYRAPCDCNTLGQMGEVSVRTMEDPSQRIVVCFFASNAERIATEKKIYIYPRICSPFFLYSNMVRPRWVQHVIFVPFVGCFPPSPFVLLQHSLSVLFKPNYTQGKPLRILESFFVWTFDLSHTCNQNDTIHNNSRCGYPR